MPRRSPRRMDGAPTPSPATAQPGRTRPRQIPGLTGIRGIAAVWVLLFHLQMAALANGYRLRIPGERVFDAGWSGVDLFFLLSGFMLMHSNGPRFARLDGTRVRAFFVARFFRVYPLAFVALLLVLLLIVLDPGFADSFRRANAGNLSFRAFLKTAALATRWLPPHGEWNEPVWSLSAELLGYAAFPLLAFALVRVRSCAVAVALAVAAIAATMGAQGLMGTFGQNDLSQTGALLRMAGYFSAGVALRQAMGLVRKPPPRALVGATGLLCAAAIVVLAVIRDAPGLMPLCYAGLVSSLFFDVGLVNRMLSLRPVVFLGNISFPLYLIHVMPIMAVTYHARLADVAASTCRLWLVALVAGLIALAWGLHIAVERRTIALGNAVLRRGRAR